MPLSDVLEEPYSAYNLRKRYPQDQGWQDLLGPLEHRQFVEEVTKRNPVLGAILLGFSPGYTGLKALGLNLGGTGEMKSSKPSLDEILGAFEGFRRGL